ncbi:MAG: 2OG-Fe(II) oxygenase [Flavobacterium sp.]
MKKTILHEHIFVIEDFLSADECKELIDISEGIGFEEAKVQVGNNQQATIKGIRNNERILYKSDEFAEKFWQRSKAWLPLQVGKYTVSGLNEMFRFYKYSPGERFKMHIDGSFEKSDTECSFYTFLIYLNDGFEGGETEFKDICTVNPRQGSLLIFYHPLWHEGKLLKEGKKYVLRSDVMYKLTE